MNEYTNFRTLTRKITKTMKRRYMVKRKNKKKNGVVVKVQVVEGVDDKIYCKILLTLYARSLEPGGSSVTVLFGSKIGRHARLRETMCQTCMPYISTC